MKPFLAALVALTLAGLPALSQPAASSGRAALAPDDVDGARAALDEARTAARRDVDSAPAERLRSLTRLGLWREADALVAATVRSDPAFRVATAELRLRQHRYPEAHALTEAALEADPSDRAARRLKTRLAIQAWTLDAAADEAVALLEERETAGDLVLLGRVRLLQRRYNEAIGLARRAQRLDPASAAAHLLEADVRFWELDPASAEAALRRALERNPFDPDARFAYGYSIWRRVDATQLPAMAEQWGLALELDPLHYLTHWHWGNGHTHLTYADYARPDDDSVRARLRPADLLVADGRIAEALAHVARVEAAFPGSVLPELRRGSIYYMAYPLDRGARLDSAQAAFRRALARRPHYGPAHNGLAAVIKQRQFDELAMIDSLEAAIAATPLPDDPAFAAVFPDVAAYPGDRVAQMVRAQLHASIVYLPFLQRFERTFRIPPLHRDLAEAMDNPFFRTATTFDNRQWMDIRGVGSGAAGIEYVERGAHAERNVVLHEYVHLFHQEILTDAERRRIRALYHDAMAEGRMLDYYAANNEHEYFAQTYTAYFAPVKVHPLNHKAMNTRADLERVDPGLFGFIDSLVVRQRAYLRGNRAALASNWAQAYVSLSEQARRGEGPDAADDEALRAAVAEALLDTALTWNPRYLPALLGRADLAREEKRFAEAARWIARAESLAPEYAPLHRLRADLARTRYEVGALDAESALEAMASAYRTALSLERDLAERAALSEALRVAYRDFGRWRISIETAEAYLEDAPVVSTYLRDRRDEAAAWALRLRAEIGWAADAVEGLGRMAVRRPQDYDLRRQYADALFRARRTEEAVETLDELQRLLEAGGRPRADYAVRLARGHALLGDTAAARVALGPALDPTEEEPTPELVEALVAIGAVDEAEARLGEMEAPKTPVAEGDRAYVEGRLAEARGAADRAAERYRAALDRHPFHLDARRALVRLQERSGRAEAAAALVREGRELGLGPALTAR